MDQISEKRLQRLLESSGHNSHTHLYHLGDKEWFWDSEREALLVYRLIGKRKIVLGDPIGSPAACQRVIEQFIEHCKENKQIPVFYQVKSTFLSIYKQLGMQYTKIGEEAQINVSDFHLNGKQWLKLRNRINKFERSGYSFQVMFPPYTDSFLHLLQTISKEWLGDRKEKSFSVGSFAPEYVSRFPVAVLVGPDGSYEAFATVAGDHPPNLSTHRADPVNRQITVDLMRYTKACPPGTMDVLFVSLFKWAKEHHYSLCSLGMSPLANACDLLIIKLLYKYGNRLYNFKGLYEYKNKFAPNWEEVYLVYPPSSATLTVAALAKIIHSPLNKQHAAGKLFSKRFINRNSFSRKRTVSSDQKR
ncbi:phosphatidylglycerol lysyltransferase domain-containing protein [Paenibacillus sp. FJAT-27812]|uniref:phosphatidylglycerol lysyltransferase domain-containing protein n=1 Tax=Paenibacillus sp. FJAT-27812 TaxID=1684143 RepID=UPI0006A7DA95|nr:phosphatidylglycerol lysyltransferase domain-containing protein [Paenibacillus sp. FJAT-27812]